MINERELILVLENWKRGYEAHPWTGPKADILVQKVINQVKRMAEEENAKADNSRETTGA